MRRVVLLLAGALALALAVPAAASAHHGRHHHRHHKAHQAHVRHFGAKAGPSDPGTPEAGTVASFTDGTLTLTLADGSTASGKVTADTVINCVPAVQQPAPTAAAAHDGAWGDNQGDDSQGDDSQGDNSQGDNQGDGHGRCGGQAACTTADLVPGAVVHEAILKLGGAGAEFKLVLLVKPQATS